MIKKHTFTEEIVACDLCEDPTGYTSDQGYADHKYHFCSDHKDEEEIILSLIKKGWEYQADLIFFEFKEHFKEIELQENIESLI